ncbi:MAG: hypothetical protein NZ523_08975 [Elioraea sp.]|nr:hypothetical protein [Elioraea sp.]
MTPERVAGAVAAACPLLLAAILVCGAPAADAANLREVAGLVAWLPLPALPASPPAIALAGAAG